MEEIVCKKCGVINNYRTEKSSIHIKAICNMCESFIKFVPQNKDNMLYFGKYKGRDITSMNTKDELEYLGWIVSNPEFKNTIKNKITQYLDTLK